MKRLVLPLLAALALPTFAGDLGIADYKYHSRWTRDKERRSELLKSNGTYAIRCGHRDLGNEICKIEFKDGKLSVNGSRGITPEQVISFNFRYGYEFHLVYKDSKGVISFASFDWKGVEIGFALRTEFMYFMNHGKDLPDNYF